jgi:flagellar motility protein MotE (MotC chaperone)
VGKWVLVTIFLITAIIAAVVVFSVTGVIDAPALVLKGARSIGWLEPHVEVYEIGKAAEEWQNEQLRSLDQIRQELDGREQALAALADELEQRAQTLDRREAELEAQAAALAQARAERMNVQHLAEIYTEMETAEAARILEKMNEAEVLEILAVMDVRTTARILEALPTERAASLSRRLGSF